MIRGTSINSYVYGACAAEFLLLGRRRWLSPPGGKIVKRIQAEHHNMAVSRDVVITGTGLVTPIGIGRDAFLSSLNDRRSGVREMQEYAGTAEDCPFRIGASIDDFDAKQFVNPRKAIKAMCREVQTGFAAAQIAADEAGIVPGSFAPERLGVVYGSELLYCRLEELEEAYRNCMVDGEYDNDRWGERSMADIFPLWMLKHLPNMAACQVGIALNAQGPNNTICHDEASGLLALIEAAEYISRGAADVMIAGGSSSRLNITKQIYRDPKQLSRRIDQPQQACRPFDAGRDGTVIGEGAGAVVLESREHAQSRGARILARIAGHGRTCATRADASASAAITRSIQSAVRTAEMAAEDLGYASASAKGIVAEDAVEATAIRDSLGDIPVTALKSYFGFTGSGAASIELAAAVLAVETGTAPATLNYQRPDPSCPVNVIVDQPLRLTKPAAVVVGGSPFGPAVSVVLCSD